MRRTFGACRPAAMELTATYKFAAAPADVWSLFMDPAAIAACLPGCRELRPQVAEHRRIAPDCVEDEALEIGRL